MRDDACTYLHVTCAARTRQRAPATSYVKLTWTATPFPKTFNEGYNGRLLVFKRIMQIRTHPGRRWPVL